MDFYTALKEKGVTRVNDLHLEQDIIDKVYALTLEPGSGQIRSDVKYKTHSVAIMKFGSKGHNVDTDTVSAKKGNTVSHVHVGEPEKNTEFTIIGEDYVDFMRDLFHNLDQECYLLPSQSVNRPEAYIGSVTVMLDTLWDHWSHVYEFSIAATDFSWIIDRDHHKNLSIVSNILADRADVLVKRRRWQGKVLSYYFAPRQKRVD